MVFRANSWRISRSDDFPGDIMEIFCFAKNLQENDKDSVPRIFIVLRSVALMVERRSPKPNVAGSSPAWPAILVKYRWTGMAKIVQFFKECVAELRKVVWPTRDDVVSSVKVVVVSTIIVAAFLGLLDAVLVAGVNLVF